MEFLQMKCIGNFFFFFFTAQLNDFAAQEFFFFSLKKYIGNIFLQYEGATKGDAHQEVTIIGFRQVTKGNT